MVTVLKTPTPRTPQTSGFDIWDRVLLLHAHFKYKRKHKDVYQIARRRKAVGEDKMKLEKRRQDVREFLDRLANNRKERERAIDRDRLNS